jgi:hypothetical protein
MNMPDLLGGGLDEASAHPPEDLPPRDHNNPPELLQGEKLKDFIIGKHAPIFRRALDLIDAEARISKDANNTLLCNDDETEGKMTEMVRQIQSAHKALDSTRMAEKQPYDMIADTIHGMFREVMDKLVDPNSTRQRPGNRLKERLERALTSYKSHKEVLQRLEAERQAKRARAIEQIVLLGHFCISLPAFVQAYETHLEAENALAKARTKKAKEDAQAKADAAEAANKAAQTAAAEQAKQAEAVTKDRETADRRTMTSAANLTRSRSQSAVSSLRQFVDFKDVNRETVDLERLRQHLPSDAIEQAIRGFQRANADLVKDEINNKRQPLRGVTFFINEGTTVR